MVDKYIHVTGVGYDQPAGPNGEIPTLNLYSLYDFVVEGGNIPGAVNVEYIDKDHFEVATSEESFEAMWLFLFGNFPDKVAIEPSDNKTIRGKALSFGENIPAQGSKIRVYPIDPTTGNRLSNTPVEIFNVDRFGFWGPFEASADTYYEFMISSNRLGDRSIHYFVEPFQRSNQLFYVRSYPPLFSLTAALLGVIPEDDGQSISGIFSANRSIITGRDSVTVDGVSLSTPDFASPEQFSVAIFLYDDNDNGQSDLYSVPTFDDISNLTAVDYFKDATVNGSTTYYYNGRSLGIPNRPSKSEGISVAMFW